MTEGVTPAAPLRIVLLLDSMTVPHWIAEQIASILRSEFAEIVGIVLNNAEGIRSARATKRTATGRIANAWRLRNRVLTDRYLRFDAWRYPAVGSDPFLTRDIAEHLEGIPCIESSPRRTTFSDYLDDESLAALRALEPDVALRFGFRVLRGPVLNAPRYGVWSYHHGDNTVNRGGPPGLWEVFLGWPSTGAVLQRLTDEIDGGVVLARTAVATHPISVHQNRITLYRAAAPLLLRKLRELSRRGAAAAKSLPAEPQMGAYSNRLFVQPTARELVSGVVSLSLRLLRRKFHDLVSKEQWQLAYAVDSRMPETNETPQTAMFRLKPLVPPPDRFWADPCAVLADGRSFIFFEELVFAENKGRICAVELDARGRVGESYTVLEKPHHLSYPFVFRHRDDWYMYVESSERGVQEVYRASSFPQAWVLDRELDLGQPVADATIAFLAERWWLFASTRPTAEGTFDDLSLFYGDSPLGPWTPHAANPVVTDARSARPAGRLFEVDGATIRPSQDCTPNYGFGIVFNRIARIDPEGYCEEAVSRVSPIWHPSLRGIHTVSAAGPLTVVDVRVSVRR